MGGPEEEGRMPDLAVVRLRRFRVKKVIALEEQRKTPEKLDNMGKAEEDTKGS